MDRTRSHRFVVAGRWSGLIVPLVALVLAGCSAGAAPSSTGLTSEPGSPELGAPAVGGPASGDAGMAIAPIPDPSTTTGVVIGAEGSASANTAIAYPYPGLGGSAGLAPDHELVVSGSGWATVKADLSNRTSAQRTALGGALADAKAQAQAAAADAGVSLGGVVSMSVSVNSNYAYPLGVVEPDSGRSTGAGVPVPPATIGSAPTAPTTEQLEVTVTVAYSIS
jgi:Protein of unknown function (DUF541)